MTDATETPTVRTTPHTRTASYLAEPGEVSRVLLLYSGGLDTSVMLKWIQDEYEAEVVALTINLGQPGEDYDVVKGKAEQLGAVAAEVVDAREEFASEYVVPAIKANAIYGLAYPLFTALGRPLIAKLAVEYARAHGCDTIAHGCTGKGNDQVRIEATIATLAPELKVIAPVRGWQMGREEEIEYARENGIPIKGGAEQTPYSIDDNLWGRSSEGRWIEDLAHAPDDDVFQLVTRPEEAPDEAQTVEIEFERGVPVAIDGERLGIVDLLERAAQLGIKHGVGIVDHIEDRIVGLKVRDIYEVPAAAILLPAHAELERLVGTIHQNQFKGELDRKWAYLVYAGLWWEPLRKDLDAYMERVNEQVTGKIGMKLYKGMRARRHARVAERGLRRAARDVRDVRRAVLPAGVAGVHRAVVAAVADGAPTAQPSGTGSLGACSTKHSASRSGRARSGTRAQGSARAALVGVGLAAVAATAVALGAKRNIDSWAAASRGPAAGPSARATSVAGVASIRQTSWPSGARAVTGRPPAAATVPRSGPRAGSSRPPRRRRAHRARGRDGRRARPHGRTRGGAPRAARRPRASARRRCAPASGSPTARSRARAAELAARTTSGAGLRVQATGLHARIHALRASAAAARRAHARADRGRRVPLGGVGAARADVERHLAAREAAEEALAAERDRAAGWPTRSRRARRPRGAAPRARPHARGRRPRPGRADGGARGPARQLGAPARAAGRGRRGRAGPRVGAGPGRGAAAVARHRRWRTRATPRPSLPPRPRRPSAPPRPRCRARGVPAGARPAAASRAQPRARRARLPAPPARPSRMSPQRPTICRPPTVPPPSRLSSESCEHVVLRHLHVHCEYSLLDGAANIDALAARAAASASRRSA